MGDTNRTCYLLISPHLQFKDPQATVQTPDAVVFCLSSPPFDPSHMARRPVSAESPNTIQQDTELFVTSITKRLIKGLCDHTDWPLVNLLAFAIKLVF